MPQHHADVVETDLGQQPLEAQPPFGCCGRVSLVLVDDQDPLRRPTPFDRPATQVVLQRRRFAMLQHLMRTRLANVDHGQPLPMMRLNLVRSRRFADESRARQSRSCPTSRRGDGW